ncbi:hypothetical protein SAMN02745196_00836 [Clostridium collagenovorans DSM 3089]|uniref:tRNA_anti-like n=1 Tax=Clostridium collagenovorans DSM 3089 TaxID=1121306 RepID=A0A1M5U4C4_9CLOT|nr:hypothetical protein [Clostridium collagenovorans]SHH57706.1 hypothetical protein SAMN02745196_00836 [Clostridium collagenovorans DSM 3089]
MKLRCRNFCIALLVFLMGVNSIAFANNLKNPIFMGEVVKIEEEAKYGITKLLVKGYIKDSEIYNEELIVIVNADTKIIQCNNEKNSVGFTEGDKVFIVLSPIMTKSIPPQSVAEKIQITKGALY